MKTTKPTSPVKASTQSFIEIEEIKDDIVLMKDFSGATVIEVGAVNFLVTINRRAVFNDLRYSGLLNSLSFPIQILIISKKIDVSTYLDYLEDKINKQKLIFYKKNGRLSRVY